MLLTGGCLGGRNSTKPTPIIAATHDINQSLKHRIVSVELYDGRQYEYAENVVMTPRNTTWRGKRSGIIYRKQTKEIKEIYIQRHRPTRVNAAMDGASLGLMVTAIYGTVRGLRTGPNGIVSGMYRKIRHSGLAAIGMGAVGGLLIRLYRQRNHKPSETEVIYTGPLVRYLVYPGQDER